MLPVSIFLALDTYNSQINKIYKHSSCCRWYCNLAIPVWVHAAPKAIFGGGAGGNHSKKKEINLVFFLHINCFLF